MIMNRLIKCTYNYLTFRSHSTLRSVMLPLSRLAIKMTEECLTFHTSTPLSSHPPKYKEPQSIPFLIKIDFG
jgi:hypothetical protein